MKLHHYCSSSGKDLISQYIDSLPEDERVDGFSVLECLSKLEWINMDLSDGKRKSYKACNEKRAKETAKLLVECWLKEEFLCRSF